MTTKTIRVGMGHLLLVNFALLMPFPVTASAQAASTPPAPVGSMPITFQYRNSPIREVLTALFRKANIRFVIDKAVTGTINGEGEAVNVPFDAVLKSILPCSNTPLTYTVKGDIYYVSVLDVAQMKAQMKDFVSPDKAIRVQASQLVDWPPPNQQGISRPLPAVLFDGAVVARPLVAHKRVRIHAAGTDQLVLEEVGAGDPVDLGAMRFDVASERVETTGGVTVFRDQGGRSLTIYSIP